MTSASDSKAPERRAMIVGVAGNLFMGAAGLFAAYLSGSQAILLDGLFSMVGVMAALMGLYVARTAGLPADRVRPYGYAADEALFVTFRALTLIGLVLFALTSAVLAIFAYLNGAPRPPLVFAPMLVYFAVIGATCAGLWGFHRWSWIRSGRQSEVLRLESQAAAFDGLVTAAAAAGLLGIELLRDGVLAPIAPIGDSLVVLVLCGFVLVQYWRDFLAGVAELAGVTVMPAVLAQARRAVRPRLAQDGGVLHDLSVSKLGRTHTVIVYYDPQRPLGAAMVDQLAFDLQRDVRPVLPGAELHVILTELGRAARPRF